MGALTDERELTVLDVGSGPTGTAHLFFPKSRVRRADIDPEAKPDLLHDLTEPLPEGERGRYDIVFASHVIEHIPYRRVVTTLKHLAAGLKPNGELWVITPSLEWAAEQIMSDHPSPALQMHLFGGQQNDWQYHRSGYTLLDLRNVMALAGLTARRAYRGPFTIVMNNREYPAVQNIVIGARVEE